MTTTKLRTGVAIATIAGYSLAACSGGSSSSTAVTTDPEAAAVVEPAAAPPPVATPTGLYQLEHLVRVDLTIAPADWDLARHQHHDAAGLFSGDCLAKPTGEAAKRPYDYVSATVSLDGGPPIKAKVRKKGFLGSVNAERPSLKVKLAEPVQGTTRLTLNNNQQDPSQVQQCLAYRAFARAGVPAPRCNLAVVTVNGNSLGIYSNVESIKRPLLKRLFGDSSGALYEGALTDFRPAWINTVQPKAAVDEASAAVLASVISALQQPDEGLLAALEPVLDLDAFLSFWVMERLVGHWDGYTNDQNNFYLYRKPGDGRLYFIPWGADAVLGSPDVMSRYTAPESVYAASALPHRLYAHPEVRERYLARLRQLLGQWDTEVMLAELGTMEQLARPHVAVSEAAFNEGLGTVRKFLSGRRELVEAAIADGPQTWDVPLRSSPCSVVNGKMTAEFQTTWASLKPANPLASGTATLEVVYGGSPMKFKKVGVAAGPNERTGMRPSLGFFALRDDGKIIVAIIDVDGSRFRAGQKTSFDGYAVSGVIVEVDLRGPMKLAGFLGAGTLTLTAAGTEQDAPVAGSLQVELVHPKYWLDGN